MSTSTIQLPHISALADKLIADIRRRGLNVGDRYLTTAEVSRLLGVQKAMAGKAMRHLVEQGILISRQRAGTFIGPGLRRHKRSQVQTVNALLPAGDPSAIHWAFQPFTAGIRSAIPEVNVQFTFVPENGSLPYVKELIEGSRASGQLAGIVAVSCPPEVYRYLAELREPAVVCGSVYSAELSLASVDSDNFQCGRLLTQYVLDRGHRRLALLMTGGHRAGNYRFFDGISDALTAAGRAPNALTQRLVPEDIEAFRVIAKEMLERPDRPTAIITRGSHQANTLRSIAASLGLAMPDDIEIVFDHQDETTPTTDVTLYPRVEPKLSFTEIAAMFGRILRELSEGIPSRPPRVVLPVELRKAEPISKAD